MAPAGDDEELHDSLFVSRRDEDLGSVPAPAEALGFGGSFAADAFLSRGPGGILVGVQNGRIGEQSRDIAAFEELGKVFEELLEFISFDYSTLHFEGARDPHWVRR